MKASVSRITSGFAENPPGIGAIFFDKARLLGEGLPSAFERTRYPHFPSELRALKANIECIEVRFQVPIEAEPFWLRKSATIHAAPAIAKFCALPAQLIILC